MEKIGNYNLSRTKENELGRGSFSIVYSATYTGSDNVNIKHGTAVAVKIIKTKNLTKKAVEILTDEIYIMELIKKDPHPNIVGCYDVIRKDNELYIIMELCDSGDLRSILKKPMKEKYAQFYFCQLANGLKYLDKHCIIHRDIKPKNILLTNKRKILKIADFGFAKKHSDQSLHETICGSPLYMAPEIMNNHMYNDQTDLWSIGMILYEMIYGNHPFENCRTIPELKDTLSNTLIEIPPSNTKNKNVSPECISLLRKLLEKKVNDRISWSDFFDHPWVGQYKYDVGGSNSKNEEYERQLYSTSVGSASRDENIGGHSISSTPRSGGLGSTLSSDNPVVRLSRMDMLTIVDNFYDDGTSSSLTMQRTKSIPKSLPITIKRNSQKDLIPTVKKAEGYSPDNCIFEMDLEETDKKKVVIKKIIEKSSILNDKDNEYELIESE